MSRIVVTCNVTLDGVMQSPSGLDEDRRGGFDRGGWAVPYQDEVLGQEMGKQMTQTGALLLGRRTYENFYSYWPKQKDNPFTDVLNNTQKYVASTTLSEPLPWENSTLLDPDVPAAVASLKDQPGKDIIILGSGALIRSLLPHHLVDEYVLLVHPTVVGSGQRLFPESGVPEDFTLAHTVSTTKGVVISTYRPAP